jgi:predicted aspartyl protease
MAKETGRVTATREALLRLRLSAGETVECLIDTGFTGALMLPQALVTRLNLTIVGREVFEMVVGGSLLPALSLLKLSGWERRAP